MGKGWYGAHRRQVRAGATAKCCSDLVFLIHRPMALEDQTGTHHCGQVHILHPPVLQQHGL